MFGPNHYVPILRWKQAERFALRDLDPSDRERITPLIELTPASFKDRKRGELRLKRDEARVLDHEAKRLLEACQYSLFFLDLRFVDRPISGQRVRGVCIKILAQGERNLERRLLRAKPEDPKHIDEVLVYEDRLSRPERRRILGLNKYGRKIEKLMEALPGL